MAATGEFIKIIFCGDDVGKNSLIHRFTKNEFCPWLISTKTVDMRTKKMAINDNEYRLSIWNFGSQERFKRMRMPYYSDAGCVIFCYSITDRDSFLNIERVWIPELSQKCPNVPVLLVATKCDLEESRCVEKPEGEELASRIKAIKFFECSAQENLNIDVIFESAIRSILNLSLEDRILVEIPLVKKDPAKESEVEESSGESWCSLISCGKFRFLSRNN